MKKISNKRKELPILVLLIIILMFSCTFIGFGVCIGLLVNTIINHINNLLSNIVLTIIVGIVYMVLLLILMRNSDSEKNKPTKWYINNILMSLIFTLIISAVTIFISGDDNSIINYIVGFLIFPLIGIITTPNIVKYVKNDTEKWKHIFYKKGNLHTVNDDNYYRVKTPVKFENKILSTIYKEQIKNILVVVGIMTIVIALGIHHMVVDSNFSNNIVSSYMNYRARKSSGFMFFLMIFFLAFGIPIIAYYITNVIKKIKVVKNHEYIAYHAIVPRVSNGKICIYYKNKNYKYNYCTCVDIKEKNIKSIPMTLIFVPDDVLLFPDNEEYKTEKYRG